MQVIGLIAALVMSWTVASKSSVNGDGAIPPQAEATYSCTYQKGDVRAGDTAVFALTQLGGIELQQVTVAMKSNKTSGAGEIVLTADGTMLRSLSGTFSEWVGKYDNSEYHPIELLAQSQANCHELRIQITGIANSLHISHFTIVYQAAATHSVTLMAGNEWYDVLTETVGGAGVVLPELADMPGLRFIGWSETEFWTATEPVCHFAGATIYPTENTTLWGVWMYVDTTQNTYVTDLKTGDYRYVSRYTHTALTGIPYEGRMTDAPIDAGDSDQVYHVRFLTAETATIRHKATNIYIGYSGTQLAAGESVWSVYHDGEETLFYTEVKGKKYAFTFTVWDEASQSAYAGLQPVSNLSSPMSLLKHDNSVSDQPTYTCHPESPRGNELVPAPQNELIVPFGIYEIHILNGKKQVRLRM